MIVIDLFKGKKIALFGLGASGIKTAEALLAGGAQVEAFDDNSEGVENARRHNIPIVDLKTRDWHHYDALILAPGVPLTHPKPHWVVALARAHNVEVIGDIELFIRQRQVFLSQNGLSDKDCPFIAITGTNGKSTTTALLAHLLSALGQDVEMGGNIGVPILALNALEKGRYYVIECSSFQIDLAPSMAPTIGILLNITPDHIERHATFENYVAIKKKLVCQAKLALIGVDSGAVKTIYDDLVGHHHKAIAVSTTPPPAGDEAPCYFADGEALCYQEKGRQKILADIRNVKTLRGLHNKQNALMAIAVVEELWSLPKKPSRAQIEAGFARFSGLPHRMNEIRVMERVLFVDDSKATNAEATLPALLTFDNIFWILGGVAKKGGIEALSPYFSKIRKAYLIGEASEQFAATLAGKVETIITGTLEASVRMAALDAKAEAEASHNNVCVLLSPACASYDQFRDFNERGDMFSNYVMALS